MAKKKSKKRRRIIIALAAAAVVAAAAVGSSFARRNASAGSSQNINVKTASVTTGSISTTVVGSGTLARDDAEDVNIPSGLTIDTVSVESGDTVKEGQTLATVTRESVASAIADIQNSINTLDTSLAAIDESTADKDVTAVISGRVKEINISSGTKVADAIADDPALMTLSADGKMAVDLTNTGGSAEGDKVTVMVSGGASYAGTVAGVSGNTITVTLTDDGPAINDTVSVTDENGSAMGSGKLYVHQPLEITASSGTVSSVKVSLNQKVSQGSVLFSLTGVRDTETEDELLAKRLELTNELKEMLELSKTLTITAPCSGTIVDVNVSAGETTSQVTSSTSSSSSSASNSSGGLSAAYQTAVSNTSGGISSAVYQSSSVRGVSSYAGNKAQQEKNDHSGSAVNSASSGIMLLSSDTGSSSDSVSIADANTDLAETAAVTGDSPSENVSENETSSAGQEESTGGTITDAAVLITSPAAGTKFDAKDGAARLNQALQNTGYTVSEVTWTDTSDGKVISDGDTFEAGHTYTAAVRLDAGNNSFSDDCAINYDTGSFSLTSAIISSDAKTINVTLASLKAAEVSDDGTGKTGESGTGTLENKSAGSDSENQTNINNGNSSAANGSFDTGSTDGVNQSASSQIQSILSGSSESGSGVSWNATTDTVTDNSASSGLTSSGTAASSDLNSSGTAASSGSASSESQDLYSSTDTTAFTVASDDYMLVSINVDELDILSVKEGQSVAVTLEALEGQSFEGTVSKVSDEGTNSGGSTKFKVTVRVPKDDDMLVGMTATATVTVDEADNVLTLPASAVQTRGSSSYVYTENNDGSLSGETEVTCGLSDGSTVEIKSGLSEGDTVYYIELTGSTISTDTNEDNMNGMMGGGDMPSGGNMPSGGGPGGAPGGN